MAFTPTVAGTYTIALTATDSAGNKGSTSATLAAANLTVTAGGPYQSISAAAVTFIATVSGPETGALTYSWNFGDGSTSTLAGPSHAYATPGSYNVTLSVTDAAGQTATAATTATVYAPVQPQITGLPASDTVGTQVTLGSLVSGGVPGADTESWTVSENGTTVTTGSGSSFAFTPTVAGTYTIVLTATDKNGEQGTTTASVTVASAPVASGSAIILDDSAGAPTFTKTGSGWAGTSDPEGWDGEIDYNAEAAPSAAGAIWQTSQVQPGVEYLVEASWGRPEPSHCNAAQYNVYDGNTLIATVTVNQQIAPSGPTYNGVAFQTLTTIIPTSGTITVVEVAAPNSSGALVADAIRIAPPGSPPSAQFNGPSSVSAGTSNATVSFANQQGGTAPYTYSYDFGDTGTFEIANSSSPTATIPESYLANPGTLVVRGRIMDSAGDYTDYTTNITIGAPGMDSHAVPQYP